MYIYIYIYIYTYRKSPSFANFCILSLFFVNEPEALYLNPGYLKSTSGINLSPANKILLTISFPLYLVLTC